MKSGTPPRFRFGKRLLAATLWAASVCVAAGGGFLAGIAQQSPLYEQVLVAHVMDGDTIELADGRRVRYIGIDAPETLHPRKAQACYSAEATARNKQLVEGRVVELQRGVEDRDRLGRLLRYAYVDGTFVNAQLVAEGAAYAASVGPEMRYRQVFAQLQQYSKVKRRGLWSACPQD